MTTVLHKVKSKDGTLIAYEECGEGPPLVLVHGSVRDRRSWAPVVARLAAQFTVLTLDRRGFGASGDAVPYAIEHEFEDVAAVVHSVGEPVHLLGHSYGGICAVEAALRSGNLRTLALYEPPLGLTGRIPEPFIEQVDALLAAGRRDAAVELMMREIVGLSAEAVRELQSDTVT